MTALRIAYLNVCGLTADKWKIILECASAYDFVFLAETWYINQLEYLRHPLTLASTYPSRVYEGRQHHGLLCLCSSSLRSLVSQVRTSEFAISVSILGQTILGVYTPPMISAQQFTAALTGWSMPSVIIGDINTRFGRTWGDTTTGPSERLLAVRQISSLFHLQHCRFTSGVSRVDHALVRQDLTPRLMACDAPFFTNHPLLDLSLLVPDGSLASTSDGLGGLWRYYLKYLDDPQVVARMLALYQHLASGMGDLLHSIFRTLGRLSPAERQEAVDCAEQMILDVVSVIAQECLGSYEVSKARTRPDRMPSVIGKAASITDAIRLYKRGFRVRGVRVWIESRDPLKTPIQDAVDFYSEVFAQPNPAWRPENVLSEHYFAVGDLEIGDSFTPDLVRKLISGYSPSKSCGSDSVHVKILDALRGCHFADHLALFFRLCCVTGLTPRRWNESMISPIPKKGDRGPICDFRPIALTQMLRRIFEMGLHRFFKNYPPLSRLHRTQAGFRHGFSTITHALVSHESALISGQDHCFIDFRMAYDTVPILLLLKKLDRRGASPGVLSLIASLFLQCSSRVVVNGVLSDPFPRSRGLFQGSILAPLLFDIFIDDLAIALDGAADWDPAPHSLLFADDVKVHHWDTGILQGMLDTISGWAADNGMVINISKSAVVASSPSEFTVSGEVLPKIPSYTYLGLPHRRRGIAWEEYLGTSVGKARRQLSSIADESGSWPPWVRLCVYRTFIRPQYEYGLAATHHIPGLRERDAFRDALSFHDSCLAWIVGIRNRNALARSLTGLPSLDDRMYALAVGLHRHLASMDLDNPAGPILTWYRRSVPWPETAILPRAAQVSLLRQLPSLPPRPSGALATLQERLCAFQLQRLSLAGGLTRYILPRCRRGFSSSHRVSNVGSDCCLFLEDDNVRQQALSWRCNTFGHHRHCVCGEFFNRRHVSACRLLDGTSFVSAQQWSLLTSDVSCTPGLSGSTYCILDSLLNHRQYHTFEEAMNHLLSLLQ